VAQIPRAARVGDQIREEIGGLLARSVRDPGIGFVTITRVHVTDDLQLARVYYTALGDEASHRQTARALERAQPFVRRQIGLRLRLRRTPEITFIFDHSVEGQDRIERILQELHEAEQAKEPHAGENDSDAE
jgi:ribosome-binding factor A